MKNIKQTVKFPAYALVSEKIPDEVMNVLMNQEKLDKEEVKKKAIELLPKKTKEALNKVGAELPNDPVDVTLSLGSFFFDMYMTTAKTPEAPLARHVFQKKSMELASIVDQEEFALPDFAVGYIRSAMMEERDWKRANVSVSVKSGEEFLFIPVRSEAANYFSEIMNAAVQAVAE